MKIGEITFTHPQTGGFITLKNVEAPMEEIIKLAEIIGKLLTPPPAPAPRPTKVSVAAGM